MHMKLTKIDIAVHHMTLFIKASGRSDLACEPYFTETCCRQTTWLNYHFITNWFIFCKLLNFFIIMFCCNLLFLQDEVYQKPINISEEWKNFHLLSWKKTVTLERCSDNSYFISLHWMLLLPCPRDSFFCREIYPFTVTLASLLYPDFPPRHLPSLLKS